MPSIPFDPIWSVCLSRYIPRCLDMFRLTSHSHSCWGVCVVACVGWLVVPSQSTPQLAGTWMLLRMLTNLPCLCGPWGWDRLEHGGEGQNHKVPATIGWAPLPGYRGRHAGWLVRTDRFASSSARSGLGGPTPGVYSIKLAAT